MDDVAGRNIDFPRIYRENEMIYVYVNGSFIYNHGIIFEILPIGSYTRKGSYKNKNMLVGSNVEEKMLPDPHGLLRTNVSLLRLHIESEARV